MSKRKKILVGSGVFIFILIVLGALGSGPNREQSQQVVQPGPEQAAQPGPPVRIGQSISCKGTARCYTAIIRNIVDGDTLDIGDFRIRLALVNTPERGQAGFSEATKFTTSTCPVGSEALVDEDDGQKEGSFDRIVAVVYCSSKNLNAELLVNKYAVIDTRFCSNSEFGIENWAIQGGCKSSGIAPVQQQPKLEILDAYYIVVEPSIRVRASTYRVNMTVVAEGSPVNITHVRIMTLPYPDTRTNISVNLLVKPGAPISWLSPKFAPGREPDTLEIFTSPQVETRGYSGLSPFNAEQRALKESQITSCYIIHEVNVRPSDKGSRPYFIWVRNNCDFRVTDARIEFYAKELLVGNFSAPSPNPGDQFSAGSTVKEFPDPDYAIIRWKEQGVQKSWKEPIVFIRKDAELPPAQQPQQPIPQPQPPQQIPAPAPAPATAKHIVINEVEANPPGVDAGNEWVELFNPLTETIDLSGWRIVTTHGVAKTYIIPQGTSIGLRAHLVIQFTAQFIDNENEQLILIDRAGNEVDRTLPINDDINDQQTWQRRSDGVDNDAGSDWVFKTATRATMN